MTIDFPNKSQICDLRSVWKEAFYDTDAFLDIFFGTAFSENRSLCAVENSEVIGMMYWFGCECETYKVAYIYAVATKKSYQGQGVCHSMMKKAHKLLKQQGYVGTILVPGEKSLFDFYSSMGYKTCSGIKKYHVNAEKTDIAVRRIGTDEYIKLRREYLPKNGVIQENENSNFLSLQFNMYKGGDFVMACSKDRDTLYCTEILGNCDNLSGIVHSLGCKEGYFKTVGDTPFAMYRKLSENSIIPTYFGLAFD